MRKLTAFFLVLVLGITGALAGEVPELTGDWLIVYSREGKEDDSAFLFLYEDSTFEVLFDAEEYPGSGSGGTWAFDGENLVLTAEQGSVMTLAWDAEAHRGTGEGEGVKYTVRLPIEDEDESWRGEAEEGTLFGGWAAAGDSSVTDEVYALMNKALEQVMGVDYVPVAYLGTQVVAGTNHAVLCRATAVVPNEVPYWAVLYLYEDLEGDVSIMNIKTLELDAQPDVE